MPVFGRVGPAPVVATCATITGQPVGWAWTQPAAHRQAVSGPRRLARGRTARPYAVVRRTRQRGGRSARGGGAGRVGPPTSWYRLRLLREIGDQLVPGVEQFLFVNDVVAVEDGPALVPGQEHGDPLGDAGADQVAGGGAAAIVEEAGRHAGRLTGGAPRRAPAPDGDAVAVEDERAGGVARRWCADAGRPTRFQPSSPSPTDAIRDGSAKLGHPVQTVTREHGLTPLPR